MTSWTPDEESRADAGVAIGERVRAILETAVHGGHGIAVVGRDGTARAIVLRVLARSLPAGERVLAVSERGLGLDRPGTLELTREHPGMRSLSVGELVDMAAARLLPDRFVVDGVRSADDMRRILTAAMVYPGPIVAFEADGLEDARRRLEEGARRAVSGRSRLDAMEFVEAVIGVVAVVRRAPNGRAVIGELDFLGEEGS